MTLVNEIQQLSHPYKRKGGKRNRKKQVGRMLIFAEFASKTGAKYMGWIASSSMSGLPTIILAGRPR